VSFFLSFVSANFFFSNNDVKWLTSSLICLLPSMLLQSHWPEDENVEAYLLDASDHMMVVVDLKVIMILCDGHCFTART